MFTLEMCHLLNYSFCFYFATGPTFLLWSFTLHILCLYSLPPGPRGEILYPRIPGGKSCERGWLPYFSHSVNVISYTAEIAPSSLWYLYAVFVLYCGI